MSDIDANRSFHMTPDELASAGRRIIDWIADYHRRIEDLPVLSRVTPGEVRSMLPDRAPETGEPLDDVLRDLDSLILPGITHWQSPSFFGYFPCNASGPSILGEMLSAGLGVQGMLWLTSPACTELETHVLDWLIEMLGLPQRFASQTAGGGVIQDTASSSTLCALLAGRERATQGRSNQAGVCQTLTAYASSQAHSSVEKAMMIAGLGRENLRLIDVDASFAMRPDALRRAIEDDLSAGRTPCFITATVGTTSSNAIDPVAPIAKIARRFKIWLHVDAAMSGTAALCPEFRWIQEGVEDADSYCFNPHKWMFTNFDCDCLYVADRAALINTLSIQPEYLRNTSSDSGAVFDYRDWHIPLGRRFRALKLWMVIRHYGVEGLQHHVREHVELAREFAERVRQDGRFELVVDPPLNLVCFRHVDGDEATQGVLDRVNGSGRVFMTHTRLDDRLVLRMSIGGTWTQQRHVEDAWRLLSEAAAGVLDQAD